MPPLTGYEKIMIDDLNKAVHKLTEEVKEGRDLSERELAWLRKVLNDLADLPGVLPPEG